MAVPKKVVNFLEKTGIKYKELEHRIVYTAYDKAATLKKPIKIIGKTLIIKTDRDYIVVLLPADKILNNVKFKKAVNEWRKKQGLKIAKSVGFAKEAWMKKNLKGIKVGATPPIGILWKLPTFVDKAFLNNSQIIINTGDYKYSFEINTAQFKKLIPDLIINSFTKAKKIKKVKIIKKSKKTKPKVKKIKKKTARTVVKKKAKKKKSK